jgi:acetyltransferase-like isoleucine patch superfamily enzyme
VGALSFVNKDVPDFTIGFGNPVRLAGKRCERLLDLEKEFLARQKY